MKKDAIQTRNRKMTTKSKKGRKFSSESDYSKAVMDMKYHGSFSPQNMAPMNSIMSSNQHSYASHYANVGFPSAFPQSHNMSYPSWNAAGVGSPASFGLSTSMVGALA